MMASEGVMWCRGLSICPSRRGEEGGGGTFSFRDVCVGQ